MKDSVLSFPFVNMFYIFNSCRVYLHTEGLFVKFSEVVDLSVFF